MTKKLDILLYAGLFSGLGGIFISPVSELFGFSPLVQEELYSFGACLFCILAFNILGYFTMRISSWLNVSYALNIRRRWRIVDLLVGDVDVLFAELWFTSFRLSYWQGASRPFTFYAGESSYWFSFGWWN